MTILKNWGHTDAIFSNETVEIHKLCIKNLGYSSKHYHANKYNIFYIDSGSINVIIWNNNDEQVYTLKTGDTLEIKPGIPHQFIANEDSYVTEIYYSKIDTNDIIRYS